MNKTSSIALFTLFSLSAACRVQLGAADDTTTPTDNGTQVATPTADPNADITEVVVVGTSTASTFRVDGSMGITVLPKNAAHQIVVSDTLTASVTVASPVGITVDSIETTCTPAANGNASAIGIIIDDSSSMLDNDPQTMRKTATVSFIKSLGAKDSAALTDYGNTGTQVRDLTCSDLATGEMCPSSTPVFTTDKALLVASTEQIIEGPSGTPLYESCKQMVGYVDAQGSTTRHGMLLLSDGQPTSMDERSSCLNAAKTANIPVFTVGLGPAAEADPKTETAAVNVLRELATETGGTYASANDPKQLDQLFANMGTALTAGHCKTTLRLKSSTTLTAGVKVSGEITVGSKGAKASFELVVPET